MSYIEANRDSASTEYQFVLKQGEETRQYWEEQNRELFAKIAAQPPKPGMEAAWEKLKAQKAKRQARSTT